MSVARCSPHWGCRGANLARASTEIRQKYRRLRRHRRSFRISTRLLQTWMTMAMVCASSTYSHDRSPPRPDPLLCPLWVIFPSSPPLLPRRLLSASPRHLRPHLLTPHSHPSSARRTRTHTICPIRAIDGHPPPLGQALSCDSAVKVADKSERAKRLQATDDQIRSKVVEMVSRAFAKV